MIYLAAAALAGAQEHADTITTDIDWGTGTLSVQVERPVGAEQASGPAAIARTQRAIRRDGPQIVSDVITQIPYDSRQTVAGLLRSNESQITAVERAAQQGETVDASATPDLRAARVTFQVDLYADLASRFVTHDRALPMEQRLGWVADTEYTGILIYAADELPVFGTRERAHLEPTLFPGFYYETPDGLLYRLAEREHMNPDQLTTQGPAVYTSDVSATGLSERLGSRPLRVLATGVFGTRPADVVLSEADALQITSSAHNRALVREGRIVIVVAPEQL